MVLEITLIVFLLVFLARLIQVCWSTKARRSQKRMMAVFWTTALVLFVATALGNRRPPPKSPPPADTPIVVREQGYVGAQACKSCHLENFTTWDASYHSSMTQLPSPHTVLGDFDDLEVEFDGKRYKLMQEGDRFFVEMDSPQWIVGKPRVTVPITLVTGSHHMQIYWYPTGQSRILSMVPIVYLLDQERWIPRGAAFIEPPDLDFSEETGRWNITCIKCHATHGRPRVEDFKPHFEGVPMDTHVSEFGIACEACHGPGRKHVDSNRDPRRRYALHLSGISDSTIVNPFRLSHQRSTHVCGQCHSIKSYFNYEHFKEYHTIGSRYRPGKDLEQLENIVQESKVDTVPIKRILESNPDFLQNSFWPDGMVRVSGREYNGLLESPCYQRGTLSCLSCHKMHKSHTDSRELSQWAEDQLGQQMRTNHACTQCHEQFSDEKTLTEHTHHLANSSGSNCYNCHMPHTTYGLLKAIRSHEITVPTTSESLEPPRPAARGPKTDSRKLSKELRQVGRPNACNMCHLDKSLGWTARNMERWYGQEIPNIPEDQQRIAASVLWSLQGDAGLRGLMAWAMGWDEAKQASGADWLAPYLAELMNDPYVAVRIIAHRSLKSLPSMQDTDFDEFATEAKRRESVARILAHWREKSQVDKQQRKATLFDENGNLLTEEFRRLQEARDDRPVLLAE